MPSYSYADCLEKSYQVNWTIDEVVKDQQFDPTQHWLPASLSGADGAGWLSDEEKRKLTHVEMGAYAHLFGYVEEFIAPQITTLALDFKVDHREGFDALTNFASEEVKHMNLFRKVRQMVDDRVGFPLELLGDQKAGGALRPEQERRGGPVADGRDRVVHAASLPEWVSGGG